MASLDMALIRSGATYRQLDHWCRKGYLSPGEPGIGVPRVWPEAEIKVAAMMVKITAAGIPPKVAERVARAGGNLEIGPGVWIMMTTPRGPVDPLVRDLEAAGIPVRSVLDEDPTDRSYDAVTARHQQPNRASPGVHCASCDGHSCPDTDGR